MERVNKNLKKIIVIIIVLVLISLLVSSGYKYFSQASKNTTLLLATTTSTENSGLLAYLLPYFEEEYGYMVSVIAVGSGKAMQLGEDGEVDVLLVHAKESEEAFVAEGHGLERFDVMYNDFVVLGPKERVVSQTGIEKDSIALLKAIADFKSTFLSRGDDSGTHKKELQLWKSASIEPKGDWYISTGKGMGETIMMANELLGYTLADRATFLSMSKDIDLEIVSEGDPQLFNQYGVIAVDPKKNDQINKRGAQDFIRWILSKDCQELIRKFGVEEYGQSLFIPNAR